MKPSIKKILIILRDLLSVVIVSIFIFALLPLLPIKDVPKLYAVVSGSMEPHIKTGALAVAFPVNPQHLKINDIIVFESPYNSKDVVVHRIIGIKSQDPIRFESKGDNNPTPDNWDVMGSSIKGKYLTSIPYIGQLSLFIRKPLGFILIILIPALILVVLQIVDIKNAINDEIERRLKKKIEGDKNPITKLFSLILLFGVMGFLFAANKSYALLNDKAKIKGFSISVATNIDDDDRDDVEHHRCPKRFTRYMRCKYNKDFHNWFDNRHDNDHKNDHDSKKDDDHNEKRDMDKYDDRHIYSKETSETPQVDENKNIDAYENKQTSETPDL